MRYLDFVLHKKKAIARCEGGLALIEFAFSLGLLLLLFFGAVEITRFVLVTQKLENSISEVTDVITQADPVSAPLTNAGFTQLFAAIGDMMNPYSFGANGFVIITDVTKTGTANPIINWQKCGGGSLGSASKIGTSNGADADLSNIPGGFVMTSGEEIVIGEIFYNFTPLTAQHVVGPVSLYRVAVYVPRLNALGAVYAGQFTCP